MHRKCADQYVLRFSASAGEKTHYRAVLLRLEDNDSLLLLCRGRKLDPQFMLPSKAAPLSLQSSEHARQKDMIPGFIRAKEVVTIKVFPPPRIPANYQPIHRPSAQSLAGTCSCTA